MADARFIWMQSHRMAGICEMTTKLKLKRVYDDPAEADGLRILVDRLWPRGLSKDKAHIDHWEKAVAPSADLRRWFGHDPEKWPEFRRRYEEELRQNEAGVKALRERIGTRTTTLLFAARDDRHNNAVALREFLGSRN